MTHCNPHRERAVRYHFPAYVSHARGVSRFARLCIFPTPPPISLPGTVEKGEKRICFCKPPYGPPSGGTVIYAVGPPQGGRLSTLWFPLRGDGYLRCGSPSGGTVIHAVVPPQGGQLSTQGTQGRSNFFNYDPKIHSIENHGSVV
jgi:hypothetical protein